MLETAMKFKIQMIWQVEAEAVPAVEPVKAGGEDVKQD